MLRIETSETGCNVWFRGKLILQHSARKPAIELGIGTADFPERFGMFRIRETARDIRPLARVQVLQQDDTTATLRFGDALSLKLQVIDERLHVHPEGYDPECNRFVLRMPSDRDEHIYGCGEQYSRLDLKGSRVPLFVQEQGVGRGKDLITLLANLSHGAGGNHFTTYFPQPTYVTSRNLFFHTDASAYAVFDFRRANRSSLEFWQVPNEIVIGAGDSMAEVLGSLTLLLGRQPQLPDWTWDGVWLGVQGGTEVVQQKLDSAREAGLRVGAVWAQDWEGRRITSFGKQLRWNWRYDNERYPDLPGYIQELQRDGIRFLGYINPFLAIGTTNTEEGPVPPEFFYNEARDKGYCVKHPDGSDYYTYVTTFPAATLDLTNPEAFAWIKGIIKREMIGIGLSGWMADFGEYFPIDSTVKSGENPELVHNRFPALWAKANYEALEETGKLGEVVFFMRSGFTGSSRWSTSNWAGDQLVNWSIHDGLASVIPAGLSLGFCGVANFHSDIGGYTTVAYVKRRKEVFMRWAELAAFTPTMRTHEGNRPDDNWQFDSDAETLQHFARMSAVFTRLKPYHIRLSEEYQQRGIPMLRHCGLMYQDDPVCHRLQYQFMYGSDLMVAPVIRKGQRHVRCYLPQDDWIHLWTGRRLQGGRHHRIAAPIGKPAVMYRANSEFASLFAGISHTDREVE
ncbi:alpha-glucosidase [Spirochaeta africana]|uniref:Family 31 glycosyl hydrolase, alpha-glucosidase n=1 Tax=Spirochaeta africana (strain ATCC 700263 / DSM 8902 / Z-7692) TaxID=889378 RepID=H9UFF1_SPIAZ|nr:alpha-glucosidase [Spirochaeta africana]AFG36244.1 family 31 glycosyl hydrolase, alpha-glucosidase [Spirochaeta africana DSM 8902]